MALNSYSRNSYLAGVALANAYHNPGSLPLYGTVAEPLNVMAVEFLDLSDSYAYLEKVVMVLCWEIGVAG